MSEPWAAFGEGMGWRVPGLKPGELAHLERMEALEAAEQQRIEAERIGRAEERLEAWAMRRMQEKAWAGESFDPSDYSTLAQTPEELAERYFAHQDMLDAADLRRRMIESGLLGSVVPASKMAAPPESSLPSTEAPAESRGSSPAPPRSGPIAKVKELLHRGGVTPCCCPSCVAVRASRTEQT